MMHPAQGDSAFLALARQAITEEFARDHVEVKRVLLFGSRARGDARPESDWDFLVIISTPLLRDAKNETILRIRRRLVHSFVPIDIIVKSEDRIEKECHDCGFITAQAIEEGVTV